MKIVGATPTGNYILVEPVEPEETTEGGLYVPAQAQEEPQVGRVVELGPEVDDHYTRNAGPGSYILYGKYAGSEVELEDQELLVVREEDVLLVLEVEE